MSTTLVSGPVRFRKQGNLIELAHDIACLQVMIVNVFFVGEPRQKKWVLVDAGMPYTAARIRRAAEMRFGRGARPEAIVLTHGHFDHVGALRELAEQWDVPVYAHELEVPYITGQSAYPPPDPTVGGGAMARLSPLYPRGPYDVGDRVRVLPEDGSVPHMPGWRWIATPGHSPGHVSFYRDSDRALIVGDAFVTTKQESFWSVMTQYRHVFGPPKYYTQDWEQAYHSVVKLAALEPELAATGHGIPMVGDEMKRQLHVLANQFDWLAVPEDGRYVREPAVWNARGVVYVPPPVPDSFPKVAATFALAALGGAAAMAMMKERE